MSNATGAPQPSAQEVELSANSFVEARLNTHELAAQQTENLIDDLEFVFPWDSPEGLEAASEIHEDDLTIISPHIRGNWEVRITWTPFDDPQLDELFHEADFEGISQFAQAAKAEDDELGMLHYGSYRIELINARSGQGLHLARVGFDEQPEEDLEREDLPDLVATDEFGAPLEHDAILQLGIDVDNLFNR